MASIAKISIGGDGESPDLNENDKQLQTADQVSILDEIMLSVTAVKKILNDDCRETISLIQGRQVKTLAQQSNHSCTQ